MKRWLRSAITIRQWACDLIHFVEATWPSVKKQERYGILDPTFHVHEMHLERTMSVNFDCSL